MDLNKEQRKKFIISVVDEFRKQFPVEYIAVCEDVKKQRKVKKSPYGLVDKDSVYMRWVLRIPTRLFQILDKNLKNPRFLQEDWENNWFKKNFKEFRVSERT